MIDKDTRREIEQLAYDLLNPAKIHFYKKVIIENGKKKSVYAVRFGDRLIKGNSYLSIRNKFDELLNKSKNRGNNKKIHEALRIVTDAKVVPYSNEEVKGYKDLTKITGTNNIFVFLGQVISSSGNALYNLITKYNVLLNNNRDLIDMSLQIMSKEDKIRLLDFYKKISNMLHDIVEQESLLHLTLTIALSNSEQISVEKIINNNIFKLSFDDIKDMVNKASITKQDMQNTLDRISPKVDDIDL